MVLFLHLFLLISFQYISFDVQSFSIFTWASKVKQRSTSVLFQPVLSRVSSLIPPFLFPQLDFLMFLFFAILLQYLHCAVSLFPYIEKWCAQISLSISNDWYSPTYIRWQNLKWPMHVSWLMVIFCMHFFLHKEHFHAHISECRPTVIQLAYYRCSALENWK